MSLRSIDSYITLKDELKANPKSFLLFTKTGSDQSDCMLSNLMPAMNAMEHVPFFLVDVSRVRDVHPHYHVNSVPTLIEFENEQMVNLIKGCQPERFYESFIQKNFHKQKRESNNSTQPSVTVYSTPTCSWCNTLKRYLDENQVFYNDIDVSKDQKKAEEMMRMSGQQGVPQTNINGKMIVGFNKTEINRLLEIK